MATTFNPVSPVHAWLRPGQRFRSAEETHGRSASDMTVTRIVQDRMGLIHAVLRDDEGREVRMFADQIQFAIEAGMLNPLETARAGMAC